MRESCSTAGAPGLPALPSRARRRSTRSTRTTGIRSPRVTPARRSFRRFSRRSTVRRAASRAPTSTVASFLTCLVLGYEIATRAGIALHATVSDYHCSGAWNALGCAAVVARLLALDDPTDPRGARRRRIFRSARPDPARVRFAVDGEGRHRLGRARRRQRGAARARRLHRRAGAHGRACRRARLLGATSARAGGSASSTSRRTPSAAGRSRRSRPRSICNARTVSRRKTSRRSPSRASAKRSRSAAACAMPATTDEAQYSLRHPIAAALVFGEIGVARGEPPAPRRSARRAAATRDDAHRGRRVLAPLSGRALGAGARDARRRPHARVRACARAGQSPRIRFTDDELRTKYRELRRAGARQAARGAHRARRASPRGRGTPTCRNCSTISCNRSNDGQAFPTHARLRDHRRRHPRPVDRDAPGAAA